MLIFPGLPYRPGQEQARPHGGQHAAIQEGGQVTGLACLAEHDLVHLPPLGRVVQAEPAVRSGPEQVQRQLDDAVLDRVRDEDVENRTFGELAGGP